MPTYRNLHEALLAEANVLLVDGDMVDSRAGKTLELLGREIILRNPLERVQSHPYRNANIFAQIAETLWVLAGRSDVGWLSHYLPRATDFSDDGRLWRAGYGPRLRRWLSPSLDDTITVVDQVSVCAHLLIRERGTRRAVIGLWDPIEDLGADSKDIPCNDLLQFIERDGVLNLYVYVRSNDIWWGWSGINAFEWSVLLEAMAYWTGTQPGKLTTYVASWHVYERHWSRARGMVQSAQKHQTTQRYLAQVAETASPRWNTPLRSLDAMLNRIFQLETTSRLDRLAPDETQAIDDPLLRTFVDLLAVYNQVQQGADMDTAYDILTQLPATSLRGAADEWLQRYYSAHQGGQ